MDLGGSEERFPDFLGIGAQKGGTTTLHRLLAAHRGVFLPPEKEIHYFSKRFSRGASWYASRFAAAGADQRCGEITPYYLFHPEAPARIHQLLPKARLIVLLRDPVERALSQYFHSRRLGFEPLELEPALAAEAERLAGAATELARPEGRHFSHQEHSYLSRSRYETQLAIYRQHFAADQLLVLRSEDLFETPEILWGRVQRFLGIAAIPLPPGPPVRANAGRGEAAAVDPGLRARLREELAPTYAVLAERYGIAWA